MTIVIRLLFGLSLLLCACSSAREGREAVAIGGETFFLELAVDPETRRTGLMHRDSIEPDGGMLFVFPASRPRSFWMGHCRTDIDILFLDAVGRVTAIHAMRAEPPQAPHESDAAYSQRMPRYPSGAPARFAIELAGGTLARLPVAPGDRIPLDRSRLAARAR